MPLDSIAIAEFQFRSREFLDQITQGIRNASIGLTNSFAGPGGTRLWIDHVELQQASLRRSADEQYRILVDDWQIRRDSNGLPTIPIEGKLFEIVQPATIFLVEESALRAGNTSGAAPAFQAQISMILSLRIVTNQGQFALQRTFENIEGLPAAFNAQAAQLRSDLAARIDDTTPLPVPAAPFLRPSTAPNAAIAASSDLKRVAIRFTKDNSSSRIGPSWRNFLAGNISDDLDVHVWSSATKPDSLAFQDFFYNAERNAQRIPNSIKFSLIGGVSPQTWSNTATGVRYEATGRYEVYDACPWTMRMNISASIELAPGQDALTFNTTLLAQTANYASTVCLDLATVMWGLVGAKLTSQGRISVEEWTRGIMDPAFAHHMLWTVLYRGIRQGFNPNQLENVTCTWNSDVNVVCQRRMEGLREVRLSGDYLVFRGDRTIPVLTSAKLGVSVSPFKFLPPISSYSCGSDFAATRRSLRNAFMNWLTASALIELDNHGQIPLFLYQSKLLGDTLSIFSIEEVPMARGFWLKISFAEQATSQDRSDFFANPYPCQVLVQTSGGARIISIDPPAKPSSAEVERLIDGAEDLANARCKALTVPYRRSLGLDLLSDPDPRGGLRIWEIRFDGLETGVSLQLHDSNGNLQDVRSASQRGSLALFALSKDARLSITHSGAAPREGNATAKLLDFRQRTLVSTFQFSPGFNILDASIETLRGADVLVLSGQEQVQLYDIAIPGAPFLIAASELLSGWKWSVRDGELWFEDDAGAWILDRRFLARQDRDADVCWKPGHVSFGGFEYRLSRHGIEVTRNSGCKESVISLNGANDLALCAGHLVATSPAGIFIYSLTTNHPPSLKATIGVHDPKFVRRPRFIPGDQLIVRGANRHTLLFDLSEPAEPKILSDFDKSPLWMSLALGPKAAAMVHDDGAYVELFACGSEATWKGMNATEAPSCHPKNANVD